MAGSLASGAQDRKGGHVYQHPKGVIGSGDCGRSVRDDQDHEWRGLAVADKR